MDDLTKKQEAILLFIEKYWARYSLSPTYKEIQVHFGFDSLNSVQNHIKALLRKGSIRGVTDKLGRKRMLVPAARQHPADASVPLVGAIAAGAPIEAIENIDAKLDLSGLGIDNSNREFLALRVRGDSMKDAHIVNGDTVVIKKQPQVTASDIAAVIWNNEATLKYVRSTPKGVMLVPANTALSPIHVDPRATSSFAVLGKVVRVIRSC